MAFGLYPDKWILELFDIFDILLHCWVLCVDFAKSFFDNPSPLLQLVLSHQHVVFFVVEFGSRNAEVLLHLGQGGGAGGERCAYVLI